MSSRRAPVKEAASDPVLLTETHGLTRVIRINRPEAFNALNGEVLHGLRASLAQGVEDGIRAIVLTGAGEKAFCAGADLKELAGLSPADAHALLSSGQDVMRAVEQSPVPVITAVNGLALGGGFELVLASTFAVMADRASLGLPEAGLGLIPGYGGTQRLARLAGRATAAHVMLSGQRVDAERAYALGLTPVAPVPASAVLDVAVALAQQIAEKGPMAVRAILSALDRGLDSHLDAGLAVETALAAIAVAGAEGAEGIAAFLDKRPPAFAVEAAR